MSSPSKKIVRSNDFTTQNRVRLLRGGKEYFDLLLQQIQSAEKIIHIQAYIFNDDETGKMVGSALMEAARRRVGVYVLADGYASRSISGSFVAELRAAGIQFRFFEPLLSSKYFYFGRRMHHKMAVFDYRYALVGGMNIADRYNDMPGSPAWLDFALFVEGDVVKQLCILSWKSWKGYPRKMGITDCETAQPEYSIPLNEQVMVKMSRNDWVRHKNEISGTYIEMLGRARKEVIILCSYFLPGKVMRRLIRHAVSRGVTVRVISTGISDVMLAKRAERWLYDWLLRNNVVLYEYRKNVLHGKMAVCDAEWMTIGSYNINNISAYASIELNLDVRNEAFAVAVKDQLEKIIREDCIRINAADHAGTKNIFRQFSRWVSYQLIRLVFYLFTFYFKRQP